MKANITYFLILIGLSGNAIQPNNNALLEKYKEKLGKKTRQEVDFMAAAQAGKIPRNITRMEITMGVHLEGEDVLTAGFLDATSVGLENTMDGSNDEIRELRKKHMGKISSAQREYFCSVPEFYAYLREGKVFAFQYRLDDFALFGITKTGISDCTKKETKEDIPDNLIGAGRYKGMNFKEDVLRKRSEKKGLK